MIVRKAYKFKLKTTPELEKQFSMFSGCCRFVWNKALEVCLERLKNKHLIPRYYELCFWQQLWKRTEEYGFLKECNNAILQQKLRDLDRAFMDAFDKKQPLKRLPKMKKRGSHDTFRFPEGIKIDNRRIYLPKIGWVGFFKSCEIVGRLKSTTVSRKGKNWFVSIQTEQDVEITEHPYPEKSIGVHLGITSFLATTEGELQTSCKPYSKNMKKLAKLQRKLSKKQKFSQNWQKSVAKVSKLHRKIAHIRSDFLHKTSAELSKNNATIFVPNLEIKKMSKSARGTTESPGKNVKAQSTQNRALLDQGWYEFTRQLDYKLKWQGGKLIKVEPAYTRLTCSNCQNVNVEKKNLARQFVCEKCGHMENAVINAALNIKAAGQAVLACGEKV